MTAEIVIALLAALLVMGAIRLYDPAATALHRYRTRNSRRTR